jgi:hypothetical protein
MHSYKGMEFAKDFNMSFAEFKEEFGSNHIFGNIHPDQREQELKKAYEIATNGNTSGTTSKVKETPAK